MSSSFESVRLHVHSKVQSVRVQVSLMLLAQCSDLTAAVLELQQHPAPTVVQKAQDLVAGWAERAAMVETLTRNAMLPSDSKMEK